MKKKPGLDIGKAGGDIRRSKVIVTPTRRGIMQAAAAAGMIGSVPAAARKSFAASSNKKPNILVIFPDQFRHDAMGCAGDPVIATPRRPVSQGRHAFFAVLDTGLELPSGTGLDDYGILSTSARHHRTQ